MTRRPRGAPRRFGLAALAVCLALGHGGSTRARVDEAPLEEAGALEPKPHGVLLVYPGFAASDAPDAPDIEAFLTLTNGSQADVTARVAFIGERACGACELSIPVSAGQTETLVISREPGRARTRLRHPGSGAAESCRPASGFARVAFEGASVSEEQVSGEQILVDYRSGSAIALHASPVTARAGRAVTPLRRAGAPAPADP